MKLGAHMPTSGGIWRALERGVQAGCESVQVFVKNNMQWFAKPFAPGDLDLYAARFHEARISPVFGHTGYLINLGAQPGPNRDKSIQSLIDEIHRAGALKLPFLVMHPGAHLGAGEPAGFRQTVAGLNEVFRATRSSSVRIALENTAGQGSNFGSRIEHLAAIYAGVEQPGRLGICLDTAHFFAAGYDIRTPAGWEEAIGSVERLIGLKEVLAFHLNDSKTPLGSRVDRHAHIGQGEIGREAFRHIVNDPRFRDHPACLETPKSDDLREDIENLRVLRSLLDTRKPPRLKALVRARRQSTCTNSLLARKARR